MLEIGCYSTKIFVCMQIGSLCMSVVEHELKRHRTLADDVAKRKREGTVYGNLF